MVIPGLVTERVLSPGPKLETDPPATGGLFCSNFPPGFRTTYMDMEIKAPACYSEFFKIKLNSFTLRITLYSRLLKNIVTSITLFPFPEKVC